jgi:hypothetical protein
LVLRLGTSVADPYPEPNPYVFGHPGSGSGSFSTRYGSGSERFYDQAKIVRKTLIPTVLWLLSDFLSLKNDVNADKKVKSKKCLGSATLWGTILVIVSEVFFFLIFFSALLNLMIAQMTK